MKLSFIGDINFRNFDNITMSQSKSILAEVESAFEGTDYRIANLETPLANKEKHQPIIKSGPNHIYSPECISFLNVLKTDVAVLANNHMGDYGDGALQDTISLLDDNNIKHLGAGNNIVEAYKGIHLEKDGIKASLIAVCENEFGVADENTCGTAGYRPRLLLNRIKEEKQKADCVIVIFHGGNEFNPLPSPETVERYRMICDMGADCVIAMHTHCPQGYELYDGKPIVYSMGNFMFQSATEKAPNDSWYYGYISNLSIEKEKISLEIVPYKYDTSAVINVFKTEEKTEFLKYIDKISKPIENSEELKKYFMGWCYLHRWFPSVPQKYEGLRNMLMGEYNLVTCEAHQALLRENYRILNFGEEKIAEEYSQKIAELSKMPL